MHRLPSITAIVPGLGVDDEGADDTAGLGAGEGIDVGFGVSIVPIYQALMALVLSLLLILRFLPVRGAANRQS